ncbi:hypothetical protein [Brevibacillus daliensis]|uniref:hypothetical protein n=1 Tax=Brevibacillus daliensis TaxID=2892995 RepID=UPI001E3B1480|nr:hypothetical protein [Brevibacillus daliensis]
MKENSNGSEIKRTFQRNLDGLHPSVTFQDISDKANNKKHRTSYKKPLVSMALVSVLAFVLLLSPPVNALFEGLFEYTKFEKTKNNEEINVGWSWGVAGYGTENYSSLETMERTYNMKIPFPQQLLIEEKSTEEKEYRVNIDEEGKFYAYNYNLQTKERNYTVIATNTVEEKPKFTAETRDGTAIDKEVIINGEPARLLGIHDMNGYYVYIEKNNWKMIVSTFNRTSDEESKFSEVLEEEVIKIVETINW